MNCFYNAEEFNENTAVITEHNGTYTYAQLYNTADNITSSFDNCSHVFLICENCFECLALYIGFLRKKIVAFLISSNTDKISLNDLTEKYKPQYIVFPDGFADLKGEKLTGKYNCIKTDFPISNSINNDLAILLTTSGSTGSPKFVMLSYKNINSNASAIAEYLSITEHDKAITTMPMNYSYGLSIINSHLLSGACIVMTEKTVMSRDFWNLIRDNEVTTFGGVPYIYQMLKKLRFGKMDLPSLKYLTQAGGKLSKELILEFSEICRKNNMKFIVMYGQTEATARMSYVPWERAFDKTGSIGLPIPGGRFRLMDDKGDEITDSNVQGELLYEGPNVSLGYAQSLTDLSGTDQNKGVLLTGDIAMFDNDGFWYITGRKKRFLKVFGNRVNLDEAENILNSAGYECICSGKDDCLIIYLVNADSDVQQQAVNYISEKTRLNRSAFKTVSIPEIPRNPSGKVLYSALEESE